MSETVRKREPAVQAQEPGESIARRALIATAVAVGVVAFALALWKLRLIVTLVFVAGIVVFAIRKQKASGATFFTVPIEKGPLRNMVNATGVVQTVVTVQVGSQVSGQIQDLYADYNSLVKRGQLLAKLDPRTFQAQFENAQAMVAAAQAHVQSAEAERKTQASGSVPC